MTSTSCCCSASGTARRSMARASPRRSAVLIPTAERESSLGLAYLPAGVSRRAGDHVQLLRRACAHHGAVIQYTRARRRRRCRLADSGCGRSCTRAAVSSGCTTRSSFTSVVLTPTRAASTCSGILIDYTDGLSRPLDLVLIGTPVLPIPAHPRIKHLGFVADQDKFDAIAAAEAAGHAVALREPVDGGARGVGARPAGPGLGAMRCAGRAVFAQQCRVVL